MSSGELGGSAARRLGGSAARRLGGSATRRLGDSAVAVVVAVPLIQAMYLVQLLLPLSDNDGGPFPATHFQRVRAELTEQFGGLTAYMRAPAQGLWASGEGPPERDDIVVYEVMTDSIDRGWWTEYRRNLERRFEQDELVVRSQEIERL